DRDALGDANDERNFRIDRLADRVRRAGGGHVDDAGVAVGLLARLGNGIEYRQAEMGGTAFSGRRTADHLGAVGDRLLGMERTIPAGDALADDSRFPVDEDGHYPTLLRQSSLILNLSSAVAQSGSA